MPRWHKMNVHAMSEIYQLRHVGEEFTAENIKDVFEIKSDITIVGRNREAVDLFIDSKKHKALISRMHARILRTSKNQYELYDTSLNGTYVNNFKITGSVILKDGDLIAFGHIRGAVISAGEFAPQSKSEFVYKFEKVTQDTEGRNEQKHNETTDNTRTPKVRSIEPEIAESSEEKLQFNFRKTLSYCENTPSDVELCNLAKEISANIDEESSEDDYSLSQLPVLCDISFLETNSNTTQASESNFFVSRDKRHSNDEESLTFGNENYGKKLKQAKLSEDEVKPDNKINYYHDVCASSHCKHPKNSTNTWVQCEDCDKWFHIKCVGLTAENAKNSSTLYFCGCAQVDTSYQKF
eukprot:gene15417-16990_t